MITRNLSSENVPVMPDITSPHEVPSQDMETSDEDAAQRAYWSIFKPQDLSVFTMPLFHSLGQHPYHQVLLEGPFDAKGLVRDYGQQLYRSEVAHNRNSHPSVQRLLLRLDDRIYVLYEHTNLVVFAPTPQAAAKVAEGLRRYEQPPSERKPGFRLVSLTPAGADTEFIEIQKNVSIDETDLALHYGDDFVSWETSWLERIASRQSGLSIVFGPPGVGKTRWLKSLMVRFNEKFVCYYLPLSSFDVLAGPSFVSFWLEQNRLHCNKPKLAVIEDAEDVLLPRDEHSRTKVSNLLNIGDGFLGEHLKLQVVATTNVPLQNLDPAITRPGRLMGAREFSRMSRASALRLAAAKGIKDLPAQSDFSLAEIYAPTRITSQLPESRRTGFAQFQE